MEAARTSETSGYQWGTRGPFPGGKDCLGVTLTPHPHLVPMSWMSRSYTFSPPCSSICVLWDFFTFSPHHCIIVLLSMGADVGFEQHVSIFKEPSSGSHLHCPHTHVSVFSNVKIQSVQKVTQPLAYLESVFPGRLILNRLWPPQSPDLIPQTYFYGGISRILCIQIIHTHCKSFRPTFSALWTGYRLAHCKTCSLTWFVVCISVKSVMVDIFSTYYNKMA
jgi:hypothetical protein